MINNIAVHGFNPLHVKTLVGNYHQYINRVLVGNNTFGLRQVSEFTVEDIDIANQFCKKFDVDCYVVVNKLFHNFELEALETFLHQLNQLQVTGVIFSDLAVMHIVQEKKFQMKLVYSTETTITNSGFTTYAKEHNIDEIEVAKEITLAEIKQIVTDRSCDVSMQIHGHLYMYQSVRKMVDNFSNFQNQHIETNELYLYDEERDNIYPLIQNQQGTHILASSNLCMIDKLLDFDYMEFKSLRIDPLLYTISQYNNIVKLYLDAFNLSIENPKEYQVQAINYKQLIVDNKKNQKYSTGLMYRKTMF